MKLKIIFITVILFAGTNSIYAQIKNVKIDTINNGILFELYFKYSYSYQIEILNKGVWVESKFSSVVGLKAFPEKYGGPPKKGFKNQRIKIEKELIGKTIRINIKSPKKYQVISDPIKL
ncbi:MAG: hypothetical protein IH948_00355 [Bacteroidetes bacterium]|nr:hypothetical protein [Bacteroidota bacterium]